MTVKAATAIDAPRAVVPAAPEPVLVRPTPIQTAVSAAMVKPDTVLPKNINWSNATHGVVRIFASLLGCQRILNNLVQEDPLIESNGVIGQT